MKGYRLAFISILLITLAVTSIAIYLDINDTNNPEDDVLYVVTDEDGGQYQNFTVMHDMNVSYIEVNANDITFNSTNFELDSTNDVLIRLDYIINASASPTSGDLILAFNESTNGGINHNISGFTPGAEYKGYKNHQSTEFFTYTADSNGTVYYYDTSAPGWIYYEIKLSNVSIEISMPYPVNNTIGNATDNYRPPINISAQINGSNLDIYIYLYNITPVIPTWTLIQNWSSVNTGRYGISQANLTTFGRETEFLLGNTTYNWSVNVTDGSTWVNQTYTYTTNETENNQNMRYDVTNDNAVGFADVSSTWAASVLPYDRIYDVDGDNAVGFSDVSLIWSNV